jgi:type IV secretory pathway TraG/TraD family ATPase VirD4
MNGPVRWDALRGDPTCLAGKLLAAEAYGPNAEVFKSSAARYLQWVGKALEWSGEQRDPQRVADLLQPPQLQRKLRSLKASGSAPSDSAERLAHLAGQLGQAEREGVSGFAARFGKVVESVAEDALGAGKSALVLEDAVRARQVVLFSLDVAGYQDLAPKLGAWVLLDLVRVAGVLQYEGWGADHTRACYVVVDEFGALGAEGRHVVPLLERSREAGMACVLASHGLADLERISAVVVKQIVQNTGTHIVLRQSSAEDAEAWARILGREQREELSRWLDDGRDVGSGSARWVRDFRVPPEDLIQLGPGDAIVQVGAFGPNKPRLERLRLAQPKDLGAVVGQRETA